MLKAEWSRYIENSSDVMFLANVSTNNKTIVSVVSEIWHMMVKSIANVYATKEMSPK